MISSIGSNRVEFAGSMRHRLMDELGEIHRMLEQSGLHDEMTENIRSWEECFTATLGISRNMNGVRDEYIEILQEMLVDSLNPEVPLDEGAILGNDGCTYGGKLYAVWKFSMPAEYRTRAPSNLRSPALFVSEPHLCVRHMIRWLASHNSLQQSAEVNEAYARLPQEAPPIDTQTRIETLRRRQEEMDQRRSAALNSRTSGLDTQILNRLQRISENENRELGALSQRVGEAAAPLQEVARNVRTLETRIEESFQQIFAPRIQEIRAHFQAIDGGITTLEERDRQAMQALQGRISIVDAKIEELTRANQTLQKNIEKVETLCDEVKIQELKLQHSINELKKSIQEKKKRGLGGLATTIALVAGTVLVNYALGGAPLAVLPGSSGKSLTFIVAL